MEFKDKTELAQNEKNLGILILPVVSSTKYTI